MEDSIQNSGSMTTGSSSDKNGQTSSHQQSKCRCVNPCQACNCLEVEKLKTEQSRLSSTTPRTDSQLDEKENTSSRSVEQNDNDLGARPRSPPVHNSYSDVSPLRRRISSPPTLGSPKTPENLVSDVKRFSPREEVDGYRTPPQHSAIIGHEKERLTPPSPISPPPFMLSPSVFFAGLYGVQESGAGSSSPVHSDTSDQEADDSENVPNMYGSFPHDRIANVRAE